MQEINELSSYAKIKSITPQQSVTRLLSIASDNDEEVNKGRHISSNAFNIHDTSFNIRSLLRAIPKQGQVSEV